MASFTYTGEDKEGKKVTQTVTADDRYAVYDIARRDGFRIISIDEKKQGSLLGGFDMNRINMMLSRVKADELVMMTRNLGSMLNAGLTVTRALSVIERQSTNPKLKGVLKRVVERINNGEQFFESLKEYPEVFSDLYVAMIKSGEESGNLAESLKTLSVQMERASNLTKKIKGAMIYPAIVITVMVIIGILMMIYVMPQITGVFKGMDMELPATTQFLINTSDFFAAHTLLTLAIMIGTVGGVVYFFKTKIGKIVSSWTITKLPVIGEMVKETNSARTARTLSSLLNSGVDVIQAIEITEVVVQNVFYKKILHDARVRVE